jgi:hypothetical protein
MRLLPIALAVFLFVAAIGFADSKGPSMPALGFYITGESGADVLDTITPELARVGFTELLPREASTERLPLAKFRRANGDEVRVTAGNRCAMLWFSGANVPLGTDRKAYGRSYGDRFAELHAILKQYFAQLPQPRPVILEGETPPVGMCPE